MNMKSDLNGNSTNEPRSKSTRKRTTVLLSSVFSLVVLAGAAFSVNGVLAQHTATKAASPALVGDIAVMQQQGKQHLYAVPPTQPRAQIKSFAMTTMPAFNNVGISTKANLSSGNFDGGHYSYSFRALINADLEPNIGFPYDGLRFRWPNVDNSTVPAAADNWQANGQVLPLDQSGTHTIGFVGAASNGAVTGTAIVTYSDGSTQSYPLGFSDWTLGGGRQSPAYGNKIISAETVRNSLSGEQNVKTYLFYASITADANKTAVSVTLPNPTGAAKQHIFAYSNTSAPSHGYNNTGFSDDANTSAGNFDGGGYSYSSSVFDWGLGYTISYNPTVTGSIPMQFVLPDSLPGTPDNYQANGQVIGVTPVNGAAKLGFVGAATGGPSYGTAYINYQDGTKQAFTLGFSDWTLNAYSQPPAFDNHYFEGMPYRNGPTGQQNVRSFLFYAETDIQPGKIVQSVTLPASTNQGHLHVYSIATGTAGFFDNAGASDDRSPVFGNFDGGHYSYSAQGLLKAGIVFSYGNDPHPFNVNGFTFDVQYGAGLFPDNWVARGQTVSVSTVSNASTLAFLGSATGGASTGNGSITYTDGSIQPITLSLSDWCASTAQYGNGIAATMSYRDSPYGPRTITNRLYYATVSLQSGKTVASVQLPSTKGGVMHIFAIGSK